MQIGAEASDAIKGGNSQTGGLSTWWNGALPNRGGYIPLKQEGAIVLNPPPESPGDPVPGTSDGA